MNYSNTFKIKRGSCYPHMELQVTKANGTPLNLVGFTDFRLVASPSYQTATNDLLIDHTLTVLDLPTGRFRAAWESGETDVPAETYPLEIRCLDSGGNLAVFGLDHAIKIYDSVEAIS